MASRIHKAMRSGILGASVAVLVVSGFSAGAHADPGAVAKAKAEVDRLGMESAALDQQALDAQLKLDDARKRLSTREGDVRAQTDKVTRMRAQVGQVALAQFQTRDLDPATQLLLRSDSDTFLSQYATIQQVSSTQHGALQDYQAAQANLADMKRGAAADVETINKSTEDVKKSRDASNKKLDEAEKVLARLTAEERARLQEEQEREAREAAAAADRAENERAQAARAAESRTTPSPAPAAPSSATSSAAKSATPSPKPSATKTTQRPSTAAQAPAPAAGGSGSSRAMGALAFARSKVGLPYIYGSTGPNGYDCSGLMVASYKSVGVSLPRTSQAQAGAGRAVSVSDLQPGDLVIYYSGASHVAMYAGGGTIVHAARSGKPLTTAPLNSMPIHSARRVA